MDFERTLMGLAIGHPLMNAGGTCRHLSGKNGVEELARSAAAAILVGSITVLSRGGNSGSNYYRDDARGYSLNALGMPNPGLDFYRKELPKMVRVAHDHSKPLGVSIAGFTPLEFADLAEAALEAGVDFLEMNAGCPNVRDGGKAHRIISYDPDLLCQSIEAVQTRIGTSERVALKVSTYLDGFMLIEVAQRITTYPVIKAITNINTLAGAFAFQQENPGWPALSAELGGYAGPAVLPIALGQVRQWRAALSGTGVQIIGVGGVKNGADVRDLEAVGATGVQMATTLFDEGASAFGRILAEMVDQEL